MKNLKTFRYRLKIVSKRFRLISKGLLLMIIVVIDNVKDSTYRYTV